ncbi:hypothetical protein DXG03_003500 [Asterophora parasitica]|uniref:Uncharacterized protein n=1 Tax=Asterophora parasitica TaxID=117018 RepID=A0A9P7GFN2_9AGAR|nr:hypothetical protein DXG03_003500 [Asterophora parasitica]
MLPSPDSSPQLVLHNRTNALDTPIQTKLSFALPTPPYDKNGKRRAATGHFTGLKKRKLSFEERSDALGGSEESENDSDDVEMENVAVSNAKARRYTTFQRSMRTVMAVPGRARQEAPSTRTILQSFVSSNKSDVFKCESNNENAFLTPPYACSYSHGAKKGDTSLLAVATEQGTLQLLNTLKRRDWDPGAY